MSWQILQHTAHYSASDWLVTLQLSGLLLWNVSLLIQRQTDSWLSSSQDSYYETHRCWFSVRLTRDSPVLRTLIMKRASADSASDWLVTLQFSGLLLWNAPLLIQRQTDSWLSSSQDSYYETHRCCWLSVRLTRDSPALRTLIMKHTAADSASDWLVTLQLSGLLLWNTPLLLTQCQTDSWLSSSQDSYYETHRCWFSVRLTRDSPALRTLIMKRVAADSASDWLVTLQLSGLLLWNASLLIQRQTDSWLSSSQDSYYETRRCWFSVRLTRDSPALRTLIMKRVAADSASDWLVTLQLSGLLLWNASQLIQRQTDSWLSSSQNSYYETRRRWFSVRLTRDSPALRTLIMKRATADSASDWLVTLLLSGLLLWNASLLIQRQTDSWLSSSQDSYYEAPRCWFSVRLTHDSPALRTLIMKHTAAFTFVVLMAGDYSRSSVHWLKTLIIHRGSSSGSASSSSGDCVYSVLGSSSSDVLVFHWSGSSK